MTHVLITVCGGIIERVTFFESKSLALRVLANFVKRMNPEEDDAAVFNKEGLVANAKDLPKEDDPFIEDRRSIDELVSDKGGGSDIYLIGNPEHRLGFMVASPDDPLGIKNPAEAVSELGQMRQEAGSHLKLYRVVPVEDPIATRAEVERYNAEIEVEDFGFELVEEYVI